MKTLREKMKEFLGITDKDRTVYKQDPRSQDIRSGPLHFDVWSEWYDKDLKKRCKDKIIAQYLDDIASSIFDREIRDKE